MKVCRIGIDVSAMKIADVDVAVGKTPAVTSTQTREDNLASIRDDGDFETSEPQKAAFRDCSDDRGLLERAEELLEMEKTLDAARLLRKVSDRGAFSELHIDALVTAVACERAISDLTGPPETGAGWQQQGVRKGTRPIIIYNKIEENNNLACRIDCAIEESLLVPLLSVLNEIELFDLWIPSYSFPFPRFGMQKSQQLKQHSRSRQTVQTVFDVPWPLHRQESILEVAAVDDIDSQGFIVVRMDSVHEGPHIPPRTPGVDRVRFSGAFLFRCCPDDHVLLMDLKNSTNETRILVSFKM